MPLILKFSINYWPYYTHVEALINFYCQQLSFLLSLTINITKTFMKCKKIIKIRS